MHNVGVADDTGGPAAAAPIAYEAPGTPAGDVVEICIPVDSAYIALLRTAAAGLAARLDFTLDEIDDLRIAVDEACSLLVPDAWPHSALTCRFLMGSSGVEVSVTARQRSGAIPQSSFAWTVLGALADSSRVDTAANGAVVITIRKERGPRR